MPRTIDSILASNKAANERRETGKPVWDGTIKLKDLLSNDDLDIDQIIALGKSVAARIRIGAPKKWQNMGEDFDFNLDDIIRGFDSLFIDENGTKKDLLAEFNGWMEELYDWSDRARIWIA
jgi:hypothetical protein